MFQSLIVQSLLCKRIAINSEITYSSDAVTVTDVQDLTILEQFRQKLVINSEDVDLPLRSETKMLEYFQYIVLNTKIQVIPAKWFSGLTNIIQVTLPTTVTEIGDSAFANSSIQVIENLNLVTTFKPNCFYGCANIEKLTINASIIPDYFAYRCTSLKEINFENDIGQIGKFAFTYCSSLASFNFDKLIKDSSETNTGYIDNYAFAYSGIKQASFFRTGERAFAYTPLEKYKVRDQGTIGKYALEGTQFKKVELTYSYGNSYAFARCPLLEEATLYILGTDKYIPTGIFENCKSLKRVIAKNATMVHQRAFYGCTSLESLETDQPLTEIEGSAFAYCYNLSLTIDGNTKEVYAYAFLYCKKVKISNYNITSVYSHAFCGCDSITSLYINTTLNNYEFYCCYNLTSVELGEEIKSIPESCFANCTKLQSVVINNIIWSMRLDKSCFTGCTNLTNIKFEYIDRVTIYMYCLEHTGPIENLKLTNSTINSYAFSHSQIKSFTYGGPFMRIDNDAFYNCSNLEKVTILKDAIYFNPLAFPYCDKVKFEFEPGNEIIQERNGLVTKLEIGDEENKTYVNAVLQSYSETTFTIPGQYAGAYNGAFYFAEKVEKIIVDKKMRNRLDACRHVKELVISIDNYSDPCNVSASFCQNSINLTTLKIEKAVTSLT